MLQLIRTVDDRLHRETAEAGASDRETAAGRFRSRGALWIGDRARASW